MLPDNAEHITSLVVTYSALTLSMTGTPKHTLAMAANCRLSPHSMGTRRAR
jgi:hypothetical protein